MKYICIFLLLMPLSATAQWRYLGYGNPDGTGGMGPTPLAFGAHDHHFFVSMPDDGILRQDTPVNWVRVNTGIDFTQGKITSFASLGQYLFVGMTAPDGSIAGGYRTSDDGASWSHGHNGSEVATNGTYVFSMGIYPLRSRDSGSTLEQMNCPATTGFAACGSCILAATSSGIYRSTDTGTNWSLTKTPSNLAITAFAVGGTHFFAGGADSINVPGIDRVKYKGFWRSDDSGLHWTWSSIENRSVNALASSDSFLFAGTDSGIYISSDLGASWRNVTDNIKARSGFNPDVTLLEVVDTLLYAAVEQGASNDVWRCVTDRPIAEMTSKEAVASVPPVSDIITLFPNPSTGMVTILSGGTSILDVRVLNVLGTETGSGFREPGSGNVTLDLSKLPSGTYFLEIETAMRITLRKVVKE